MGARGWGAGVAHASRRGSILVTGGEGRLAATVSPALAELGWEVASLGRSLLDVTDAEGVAECLAATAPDVVLNLAAWTDLDGCEREPQRAEQINAIAVGHLREATEAVGAHLVHISSDYVFDGLGARPYRESDEAQPLNEYGTAKLLSEALAGPSATVLRTSWISGRYGRCLVRSALEAAEDPTVVPRFVVDQFGSPTVADDLVAVLDEVAQGRVAGLFHVAGTGVASPHDLAVHVFEAAGCDTSRVLPISTADRLTGRSARRPAYSVLDSSALRAEGITTPGDWRASVSVLVDQLVSARHP